MNISAKDVKDRKNKTGLGMKPGIQSLEESLDRCWFRAI